ncbi:MAG: PilZ domain-containing protein [Elusimicrobia bacterium]|nr:PilZ domain-containing protein [Candidatus Obscuribacterium magneticum]
MHLPGFDRFNLEGRVIWKRPKENTSIVGIQFTKIDPDHGRGEYLKQYAASNAASLMRPIVS